MRRLRIKSYAEYNYLLGLLRELGWPQQQRQQQPRRNRSGISFPGKTVILLFTVCCLFGCSVAALLPLAPPLGLLEIKHVGFYTETLADARHRTLDPLFAVAVGVAAAGMRIQREEREKGRKGDVGGILRMLKNRGVMKWKGEI